MADQKISQLTDGTSFQAGDEAVVNRSGTNFKVDPTQFGDSIDVTGTITADGLTVDGEALLQSSTGSHYLKFYRNDPTINAGNALGQIWFGGSDAGDFDEAASIKASAFSAWTDTSSPTQLDFYTTANTTTTPLKRATIADNGDISFYEDTGTTPKFFWDASAEALGIGTTSPSSKLTVEGTFAVGNGVAGAINYAATGSLTLGSTAAEPLILRTGAAEAARIDASGNVGIGTSSPAAKLTAVATSGEVFRADASSGAYRIVADQSGVYFNGNVGIGTFSPGTKLDVNGNILADGIYLGGTGAANLLDDYEEGTFTPVFADASSGGNAAAGGTFKGQYTKIGRNVYVACSAVNIDTTGMTAGNGVFVQGLPFTAGALTSEAQIWSGVVAVSSIGGAVPYSSEVGDGNAYASLMKEGKNSLLVSDLTSGSTDLYLSFWYQA